MVTRIETLYIKYKINTHIFEKFSLQHAHSFLTTHLGYFLKLTRNMVLVMISSITKLLTYEK